jgi:hypothetical protein
MVGVMSITVVLLVKNAGGSRPGGGRMVDRSVVSMYSRGFWRDIEGGSKVL